MVVSCGLVSYERSWSSVGNARTWLAVMWIGSASAVFDLVRNVAHDSSHCSQTQSQLTFVDHFIAMFGIESASKIFGGKVYDWLKKCLFYFEFIFTFQLDGCAEFTSVMTCFIHFVISHRPENIRLMLLFFK